MKIQIKYLPIVIFSLITLISCKQKVVDLKSETENLLNTDKEFSETSKEKGAAEAFRLFLAEDALQFSGGRDVVVGGQSVYEIMIEGDDTYTLLWEPQFAEVASSGDFGWTWGYYDLQLNESGETRYGKYLNVWKKNKEGKWKVAADIGNPGPDKEGRTIK